jgi:hypothetical protein
MASTHITSRLLIRSRQNNRHLDIPCREAKLVPCLHHPAPVLQAVVVVQCKWSGAVRCQLSLGGIGGIHGDDESAVAGRDLLGVVPFKVSGDTVPQVDSFPERVVACVGEEKLVGVGQKIRGKRRLRKKKEKKKKVKKSHHIANNINVSLE